MAKTAISLIVLFAADLALGYVETPAADIVEKSAEEHEDFIPQVAFHCGYKNQYLAKNGFWTTDNDKYATCLRGKLDILKYCRKVYPDLDITNIVEDDHLHKISDWCKDTGSPCKWEYTIRPYRCIVGSFQSEALLVPQGCRFGHVDDRQVCETFEHWKNVTEEECAKRQGGMDVRSFAMLAPCGLEMFSGVEFVCCQKGGAKKTEEATVDLSLHAKLQKEEDNNDENDEDDDDYSDEDDDEDDEDYDDDDDYEDDEDEESHKKAGQGEDPYFRTADPDKEHEMYKAALARLDKQHKQKVAKVMREWSELENRYEAMKKTDPKHAEEFKKEMTSNFQKTVAALEDENLEERRQLDDVHTQRVQAALNERKRETVKAFRDAMALSMDSILPHKVLKTLQAYIRAEEKDRLHSLNHYRHMLRVDPDRAADQKESLVRRLKDIDLRIQATIAMLHDMPELEKKVKAVVLEFWRTYRKENTPDLDEAHSDLLGGTESNKRLLGFYEHQIQTEQREHEPVIKQEAKVKTEELHGWEQRHKEDISEPQIVEHVERPHQAHARRESLAHSANVHMVSPAEKSASGGMLFFGLAGVVLVVATVLGVYVMKKNRRKGFEKVNTYSPEEQHVEGMQVSGYENPTYNYFDAKA